ncbi:MAG TPA: hypothetical protein ENO05_02295 [Bacteroides sp.]|nr:hypothetical protein [Bacteroides sp.]
MYRLITILILSGGILLQVSAQEPGSFSQYETETYRYYLEGNWDGLIRTGKEAIREGMDYYYLRMRMGIAYYSKKNYRRAAHHFTRALQLNHQDPAALEYLYYCRVYTGQQDQAALLRKQFRGDLALKLPSPGPAFFDRAGLEYLYCQGLNRDIVNNPLDHISPAAPGVQYITTGFSNVSLSLSNAIAPGISLDHAYTGLAKNNLYYYFDGINRYYTTGQQVRQHQYYFSPRFTTASGLQFIPVFHLVRLRYQVFVDSGTGYQGGSGMTLDFTEPDHFFLTGLALVQRIGPVDLHLGGYYSDLNHTKQLQNRIGLTWYPLGNLNLYAGGFANSLYETGTGEGVLRLIPEILIGFSMAEKAWIELGASAGEMENYTENFGAIIYNSYGEMPGKKARLSVSVPVSKKGSMLYLGGLWSAYRSWFMPFDPVLADPGHAITYQTFSIYGGISWKF